MGIEGTGVDDLEGTSLPCLFPLSLAVKALWKPTGRATASCLGGCGKMHSWCHRFWPVEREVMGGEGAAGGLSLCPEKRRRWLDCCFQGSWRARGRPASQLSLHTFREPGSRLYCTKCLFSVFTDLMYQCHFKRCPASLNSSQKGPAEGCLGGAQSVKHRLDSWSQLRS